MEQLPHLDRNSKDRAGKPQCPQWKAGPAEAAAPRQPVCCIGLHRSRGKYAKLVRYRLGSEQGQSRREICDTLKCMAREAIPDILEAIDREIANLQQVRRMLGDGDAPAPAKRAAAKDPAKRPGRPAGAKGVKRQLSEEARARIAAAQKKRWAAKKDTPEKAAAE